jgi:hypothetical protein
MVELVALVALVELVELAALGTVASALDLAMDRLVTLDPASAALDSMAASTLAVVSTMHFHG